MSRFNFINPIYYGLPESIKKMSSQTTVNSQKSEQLTSLVIIGGRDCKPGALLSHQNPDLSVKGGGVIEKSLVVSGNVISDSFIIGNVVSELLLVANIQEKYLEEGIDIIGDIRMNCGNIFDMKILGVDTLIASCGNGGPSGNTISVGNDMVVFGNVEVGQNLIVSESVIIEQELHVVGNVYFAGNVTLGLIDATSLCVPTLTCVQSITGPSAIFIEPLGNITNVVGHLNADSLSLVGSLDMENNVIGNVSTIYVDTIFGPVSVDGDLEVDNGKMTFVGGITIGDISTSTWNSTATAIGKGASVSNVTSGLAIGGGAVADTWVLNTSGPFAVSTDSSALAIGDISATYTAAPTHYMRIRFNGQNFTMPLYADQ
jgi:hypothetical protein